jgi:cobalt-zinc-cadmium efflux system membrane fusion protein
MKRQLILIFLVLAVGLFGAWRILGTNSRAAGPESRQDAKNEPGNDHAGEHKDGHPTNGAEEHIELSPEALRNANLEIEIASSKKIKTLLPLYGKIVANEEAVTEVMPRFPGIVKAVHKRLGDAVQKGEVLALVESNESLRTYEIRSELSGTITSKDVTLGEFVKGDSSIFVVSDLSSVWVDLSVFRQDFPRLEIGQSVDVQVRDGSPPIQSTISYVSPFGAESTQTMLARTAIPNPTGDLRPGFFVTADVLTSEALVQVAVKTSALQTFEEKAVVFVQEGDAFKARPVTTGARDREFTEVISGLEAGASYAATNSFILKAELGKAEAAHDH